ncbi:hypothetical protein [Streptomyces sp. NPDC094147]|uniref:hypothetical protein n=1 Tax=Streptomyces sp. NPDC094147 TaxID=3366057 RepID=UPI0037FF5F7E
MVSRRTADAPVRGHCTTPDAELRRPCPTCGQAERLHTPGPCPRRTLKRRRRTPLGEALVVGSC